MEMKWRPAEKAPAGREGLVYCDYGNGMSQIWIAEWRVVDAREDWFDSEGNVVRCATHWMPLPSPPADRAGG